MEDTPLYSSRVIKTYVEYLEKYYPHVNTKSLLEEAGITPYELEDGGHWLTQRHVDRFHEVINKAVDNPNIAREAGRFAVSAGAFGAIRQYIFGFLSPLMAYRVLEKIASVISRHVKFKVEKLGSNSIEVNSTPYPGVKEKPYQCENRIGYLEALAKLFTSNFAKIEHPVCLHRGGDKCRYIVSWQETRSSLWRRLCKFLVILFPLLVLMFSLFIPAFWIRLSLISAIAILATALYAEYLEKKDLSLHVELQGNSAENFLDQLNKSYNNALLIKEISQAVSSILDLNKLLNHIMETMEKRLDFDRGMIMLADREKTRLVYTVGYGYNPEYRGYLQGIEFRLDNPDSRGPAVVAFKKQKPFLVDSIHGIEKDLSQRSLDFAKRMGTESFICVPIVYEKDSIGVLMVDNIRSKRRFSQSDISLLAGIANQIAISINNAVSYQKIQESEERFRSLSENAPDIIYTVDLDGLFTYVNPAWERILGHRKEEVMGKYFTDFVRKEDTELFKKLFDRIRDGETVQDFKRFILHKNGSERLFNFNGAPNFDPRGNVAGIVGTMKDMTEQRNLEIQLRQAQKMEAIGTLAGGIAHDFNNILGAIIGYTEMAVGDLPQDDPVQHYLDQVLRAGDRAKDLVKQILAFSRQTEQEFKPLRISPVIKEAVKLLRASLPSSLQIIQNIRANTEMVLADPTQIHQVLMNLCTNSAHAMREKGGTLKISLTRTELTTTDTLSHPDLAPGTYIELAVSDTGHGIDPGIIERIFDPFFTTKKPGEGTGMGLSVVHGIIKNHGGVITVQSSVGKGTTFRVFLPVFSGKDAASKPEPAANLPGGRECILFVDDEDTLVELAQIMLGRLGYKVEAYTSSIEALEAFRSDPYRFDLIITDMTMPNMIGTELAFEVLRARPDIPVILTTGFSESVTPTNLQEIGIRELIIKPLVTNKVAETVRRVLDHSKVI